mmetsp:Transcript_7396/g.19800  ORF Transcript_7396/g.19800 Transcript_7396/m.19800 type:complete len:272 (+) Transcript_7396:174-989(+)
MYKNSMDGHVFQIAGGGDAEQNNSSEVQTTPRLRSGPPTARHLAETSVEFPPLPWLRDGSSACGLYIHKVRSASGQRFGRPDQRMKFRARRKDRASLPSHRTSRRPISHKNARPFKIMRGNLCGSANTCGTSPRAARARAMPGRYWSCKPASAWSATAPSPLAARSSGLPEGLSPGEGPLGLQPVALEPLPVVLSASVKKQCFSAISAAVTAAAPKPNGRLTASLALAATASSNDQPLLSPKVSSFMSSKPDSLERRSSSFPMRYSSSRLP